VAQPEEAPVAQPEEAPVAQPVAEPLEPVAEQPVEPVAAPVAEATVAEPVTQQQEVSQAATTLVKYFSDTLANSLAEKLNQNNSDVIQNGFDSVNQEVNTMATSGGQKRRKTRKFKLAKKNKSRQKRY